MEVSQDKIELLAKDAAWGFTGHPLLGGVPPTNLVERGSRLYRLGWSDCLSAILHEESVFLTWLRSLDQAALQALAPLLDDERVWLRHDNGRVTLWLQEGDAEPEEVTVDWIVERAEMGAE